MKSIEFEKVSLDIMAGTSITDVLSYSANLLLDPRYQRLKEISFNFNGMKIKITKEF